MPDQTSSSQTSAQIIIGTRGSPLALQQAHSVRTDLLAAHPHLTPDMVDIKVIKTSGDKIQDRHLMLAGGKGLFTKEIEEALLEGHIHMAVHSCKDMPTKLPDGLALAAFTARQDPRDAFLSHTAADFASLPQGAIVGTASLRRRAQSLRLRPDLKIVTLRGNVQTRLKKLREDGLAATFLACAGLNRLGMSDLITETLDVDDFLPAPAQGIVTIETREDDTVTRGLLTPLHDRESAAAGSAERAFLAGIDGSCRTPMGAFAFIEDGHIHLKAELLSVDGQCGFSRYDWAPLEEATNLGHSMAEKMRAEAGEAFFKTLMREAEEVALS